MHLTSGSTVESMPRGVVHDQGCHCWPHTEYAALEAARETTANVLQAMEGIQLELRQSRATEKQAVDALVETQELARATEAELRGKVERQPSVIRLAEDIIGGHSGHLPGASSSCPRCQWDAGLAALDAAEQPARAEEGPQQPAEETR